MCYGNTLKIKTSKRSANVNATCITGVPIKSSLGIQNPPVKPQLTAWYDDTNSQKTNQRLNTDVILIPLMLACVLDSHTRCDFFCVCMWDECHMYKNVMGTCSQMSPSAFTLHCGCLYNKAPVPSQRTFICPLYMLPLRIIAHRFSQPSQRLASPFKENSAVHTHRQSIKGSPPAHFSLANKAYGW